MFLTEKRIIYARVIVISVQLFSSHLKIPEKARMKAIKGERSKTPHSSNRGIVNDLSGTTVDLAARRETIISPVSVVRQITTA
jgi:hypothetical protein